MSAPAVAPLRGTGFRAFASGPRPEPATLAAFGEVDSVNVADAMFGFGAMDSGIQPIYKPIARVVGPALTVTITPGNGMMIRKAITLARPGDVMVVNGAGTRERAVLGGSVAMDMVANGIAALVLDGALRDVGEIRELGFPVFARALTPRSGSDLHGRGEVNGPVACGGVAVLPGDLVLADEEGVVVVPRFDLAHVLERAREVQGTKGRASEVTARRERATPGHVKNIEKLEAALHADGCIEYDAAWADLTR